jgi:hypothetical protein
MKYPKTLAIQKQENPGDKWYQAEENANELNDGEVAVYTLTNMVIKETKTLLHPKK